LSSGEVALVNEIIWQQRAPKLILFGISGKTTALIYKMRTIEQTNLAQNKDHGVRQMFVTRSRVLAQHVEATYQGLIESTNVASKSLEELKEMAKQSRENPDRALAEFDSEIDLRHDLPERFTLLQDSNFPLFVSFDKVCYLTLQIYEITKCASRSAVFPH
jgi:hypothetical protein